MVCSFFLVEDLAESCCARGLRIKKYLEENSDSVGSSLILNKELALTTAKILNSGFWQSLTLTLSHNSTGIILLLVNLNIH